MDTRKILIADGTDEFREALTEALQGSYYVRSCKDGQEALSLLRSFSPDILVLDLFLPGLDGISLLHSAAAAGIFPMVLATGRFISDYMTDALGQLGVEYIMLKPCNLRGTIDRIQDLSRRIRQPVISQPDPRSQITSLLVLLGVPAKFDGYAYLREAVLMIARKRGMAITKELYPAVASLCRTGVDGKNVERSIRNAIEKAWANRDDRIWQMYFAPGRDGTIPKPSNSQFIHALADSLQLQQERKIG